MSGHALASRERNLLSGLKASLARSKASRRSQSAARGRIGAAALPMRPQLLGDLGLLRADARRLGLIR